MSLLGTFYLYIYQPHNRSIRERDGGRLRRDHTGSASEARSRPGNRNKNGMPFCASYPLMLRPYGDGAYTLAGECCLFGLDIFQLFHDA